MTKPKALLIIIFAVIISSCKEAQLVSPTSNEVFTDTAIQLSATSPTTSPSSPTIFPTWTLPPTLSTEETQERVIELSDTNGDCKLPCWWGIVPGHSTWGETRDFLYPLSNREIFSAATESRHDFRLDAPDSISPFGFVEVAVYIQNDIVQRISTGSKLYPIHRVLNEYGQPDEIWIRGHPVTTAETPWFIVALNFPDLGILATYYGDNSIIKGDSFEICLNTITEKRNYIGYLSLWDPAQNLQFNQLAEKTIGLRPFLLLEEATSITQKDFYETYQYEDNQSICFETPLILWP